MQWIAFHCNKGRFFFDALVRSATQSEFSHCEFLWSVDRPATGETHLCISAWGRDGEVRKKEITFMQERWVFLPVLWAQDDSIDMLERELGKRYDLYGLIISQFLNFRRHRKDWWFCSEICAHALELKMPQAYAPGDLHRIVAGHNRTFQTAQTTLNTALNVTAQPSA
jgi:hypothetical protein